MTNSFLKVNKQSSWSNFRLFNHTAESEILSEDQKNEIKANNLKLITTLRFVRSVEANPELESKMMQAVVDGKIFSLAQAMDIENQIESLDGYGERSNLKKSFITPSGKIIAASDAICSEFGFLTDVEILKVDQFQKLKSALQKEGLAEEQLNNAEYIFNQFGMIKVQRGIFASLRHYTSDVLPSIYESRPNVPITLKVPQRPQVPLPPKKAIPAPIPPAPKHIEAKFAPLPSVFNSNMPKIKDVPVPPPHVPAHLPPVIEPKTFAAPHMEMPKVEVHNAPAEPERASRLAQPVRKVEPVKEEEPSFTIKNEPASESKKHGEARTTPTEDLSYTFYEFVKRNDPTFAKLQSDMGADPKFMEFFTMLKKKYVYYQKLPTDKMIEEIFIRPLLWVKLSSANKTLLQSIVDRNLPLYDVKIKQISSSVKLDRLESIKSSLKNK